MVLTCGSSACRHTFVPDLVAFAAARLCCPRCGGWTFQADLVEPATTTGEGRAMGELTPAQRQSEFLILLAAHLLKHPHLAPVYVGAVHHSLQVPRNHAHALVAWCASAGVTTPRAQLRGGYASAHTADAVIGGHRTHLWGVVEGLEQLLTPNRTGAAEEGLALTVAELAHLAEHGVLPALRGAAS
jgi:hypothetical protein